MKTPNPIPRYALIIGIVSILMMGEICSAQQSIRRGESINGFRGLKWGNSVEEASNLYDDFIFNKYEIVNSKEEPSKIYIRNKEHGVIDNVVFDGIEYWFKNNEFYQIKAILHSRFGPRTLVTSGEEGFEKLVHLYKDRYGEPMKNNVDYINDILSVIKEATWEVGKSTITLRYEGPKDNNEDRLLFEIRRRKN